MRLGIDVGSTTVKLILLDKFDKIVYEKYERHMSSVFEKVKELLGEYIFVINKKIYKEEKFIRKIKSILKQKNM